MGKYIFNLEIYTYTLTGPESILLLTQIYCQSKKLQLNENTPSIYFRNQLEI